MYRGCYLNVGLHRCRNVGRMVLSFVYFVLGILNRCLYIYVYSSVRFMYYVYNVCVLQDVINMVNISGNVGQTGCA